VFTKNQFRDKNKKPNTTKTLTWGLFFGWENASIGPDEGLSERSQALNAAKPAKLERSLEI
jgi:hypothetical protein